MKIYSSLVIAGAFWSAELCERITRKGQYIFGAAAYASKEICVAESTMPGNDSATLSENTQAETLMHEVTHAILHSTGVECTFSHRQTESIADSIGVGMARFIAYNPKQCASIRKAVLGKTK